MLNSSLNKSLYVQVTKEQVINEYKEASRNPLAHQKSKWGSRASMLNRFYLGLKTIDWNSVATWLDVGCGMGTFFSVVEGSAKRFNHLVGIDINPEILNYAHKHRYFSPVQFIESDIEEKFGGETFDLVSSIGVLQKCGSRPEDFLKACVKMLKPGGQIFMTTKHIGWKEFSDGRLTPNPNHSWFEYKEIVNILQSLKIDIIQSNGFMPREAKIVSLENAHTLYILGIKSL
jgi:2-polyprenyl-3-methyl-5-hydroxy-6-metoxy-1,4-benzoquinol methylase